MNSKQNRQEIAGSIAFTVMLAALVILMLAM